MRVPLVAMDGLLTLCRKVGLKNKWSLNMYYLPYFSLSVLIGHFSSDTGQQSGATSLDSILVLTKSSLCPVPSTQHTRLPLQPSFCLMPSFLHSQPLTICPQASNRDSAAEYESIKALSQDLSPLVCYLLHLLVLKHRACTAAVVLTQKK